MLQNHDAIRNSTEILTSPKIKSLVTDLRDRYEKRICIFDLPPLQATDDAIAYSFQRGPKQVLVTPKVPRNITFEWTNRQTGKKTISGLQPQLDDLINELGASQAASESYREMLQKLSDLSPDIWLPALPLTGQIANLYDDDWQTMIKENRRRADKFQVR